MAILTPSYVEYAAIELDSGAAFGEPPAMGGNERSAGARAAGSGHPGASFPNAHPDCPGTADLGDTDISALRKERVMFECRPDCLEIDGVDVLNKEGRVRVADVGADRLRQ